MSGIGRLLAVGRRSASVSLASGCGTRADISKLDVRCQGRGINDTLGALLRRTRRALQPTGAAVVHDL
jgi:hypothetical protein